MIALNKDPFVLIARIALIGLFCGMISLQAQPSGICHLDAGEDITVTEEAPIFLNAEAVNISDHRWGTYGDGFFGNEDALSTFYVPGPADLDEGEVKIFIRSGQPDLPNDDYVDYYTVKDGEWDDDDVWNTGEAPPQNIDGLTLVLKHDITVTRGIIKLNRGSQLYADNITFRMYPNRSFIIQDASAIFFGGAFLQLNELPDGSPGNGSAQGDLILAKRSSKLIMRGTEVHVSGNFHNNGMRVLEDVSLKVDRHYQNTGSDILINVCAEVAYEQSPGGGGQGPGNIHNAASADYLYVENTTMYTYNGNLVNNSKLYGKFNALYIEDGGLVNTGEWLATIDHFCADHGANGSYEMPLPEMDCPSASEEVVNCSAGICTAAYDELLITFELPEDTIDVVIHEPGDVGGPNPGDDDDDDEGPGGPSWPFGTNGDRLVDMPAEIALEIYPNPVHRLGRLQMAFPSSADAIAGPEASSLRVRLMSINGSIVHEAVQNTYESLNLASIPGLEAGIYVLEAFDGRRHSHTRIVVAE